MCRRKLRVRVVEWGGLARVVLMRRGSLPSDAIHVQTINLTADDVEYALAEAKVRARSMADQLNAIERD